MSFFLLNFFRRAFSNNFFNINTCWPILWMLTVIKPVSNFLQFYFIIHVNINVIIFFGSFNNSKIRRLRHVLNSLIILNDSIYLTHYSKFTKIAMTIHLLVSAECLSPLKSRSFETFLHFPIHIHRH